MDKPTVPRACQPAGRFIAFPKNNAGRDVMIDAPSRIDEEQLQELGIGLKG
jgi:aspartyl-tRNA synthetase